MSTPSGLNGSVKHVTANEARDHRKLKKKNYCQNHLKLVRKELHESFNGARGVARDVIARGKEEERQSMEREKQTASTFRLHLEVGL